MKRSEERAALLVIDLERGFIDESSPLCIRGAAATLPACGKAIAYAREAGVPVFFIHRAYRANGSDVEACRYPGWQAGGKPLAPGSTGPGSVETPPEVTPQEGDYMVLKPRFSAFFHTELDLILRRLGVRTLYLTGTTTPNCVRSTAYDGLARGFNVAVLRDATSSRSPEAQEANLADMEAAGIQLIHTDDFAANGLLHVRDTEAEVARALALELEAKARNTETDAAADTAAANGSGAPLPPTPTLESIETVSTGWINKYHLHYTLPDGRPYTYEGVSRKGPERYEAALEALGSTGAPDPDAVCIVPLLPDGSVLLEREFRYPLNSWCVSLPAGLIDAGESLEEAVARELSEETGYRLRDDIAPAVRPLPQPGFSSTGLTEENVQVVFAQVEAAGKARPDSAELIEPFTVARADLRAFLDANQLPIGTRCQLILELLAI